MQRKSTPIHAGVGLGTVRDAHRPRPRSQQPREAEESHLGPGSSQPRALGSIACGIFARDWEERARPSGQSAAKARRSPPPLTTFPGHDLEAGCEARRPRRDARVGVSDP